MHVLLLFDLPVKEKKQLKRYAKFRKTIQKWGFERLQNSVYVKDCENESRSTFWVKNIRAIAPPEGKVMIIKLPEERYSKIVFIKNREEEKPKSPPPALLYF